MLYPKVGELKTFWTNYHCCDEDCPGKRRNDKRMQAGKVQDGSRTDLPGPRGMVTAPDERHLRYAPGYWE